MRQAGIRLAELYKTSPMFQDLIETSVMTAATTAGQAAMTDLSPQELALAAAVSMAAGMVGRPIVGKGAQMVGKQIDKTYPKASKQFMDDLDEMISAAPKLVRESYNMKMAPYRDMGNAAAYANMLGRGYGDNIAQLAVSLAAPGLIAGGREDA